MPSPGKGKAKKNSSKGKKGGKKGKESHSSEGYEETTTEHSRFEGECRNVGKAKAGSGKSKSKVTEISESDSSSQVEETWTPNTSTPQPSLSQVNTIGCADEDSGSTWSCLLRRGG